jgi:acetyl-CoA carboxylase carboxyl transferase subunit alpha
MEIEFDFEKPVIELENRLSEMRKLAAQNNVNVDANIESLEKKILELKKISTPISTVGNGSRLQGILIDRIP